MTASFDCHQCGLAHRPHDTFNTLLTIKRTWEQGGSDKAKSTRKMIERFCQKWSATARAQREILFLPFLRLLEHYYCLMTQDTSRINASTLFPDYLPK